MQSSTGTSHSIGDVLARLRADHRLGSSAVAQGLATTSSTYLKIERNQRELSFLMALRVCAFYKLDLHEFASMLSEDELSRQDLSTLRVHQQRERKKAEAAKAPVFDIQTKEVIPAIKLKT